MSFTVAESTVIQRAYDHLNMALFYGQPMESEDDL
jgi:hypothetical protein